MNRTWILWDGDCPMCARCVGWIARHDTRGQLLLKAYQDAPSPPMTPALRIACESALHAVTPDGTVLRGARGVIKAGEATRFRRAARVLSQPPFVWVLDAGYKVIARNRGLLGRFVLPREPRLQR